MSCEPMKKKLLNKTAEISKNTIKLSRKIPNNQENRIIKNQFLRSVFSIGANYREAIEAESRKDFTHRLCICKKEAKESLYWIELLLYHNKSLTDELKSLETDIDEIYRIIYKSIKTLKLK